MKLNHFIINSDYTANKQKGRYPVSLNVPSRTLSDGSTSYRFTNTVTVPEGTYFENVNITTTLNSENYASNAVVIQPSWNYAAYISVYQKDATTYEIACTLTGFESTTTAFTTTATLNLSVSPF